MFLLRGNFVIPCKVGSCLLWHLPCKMQDTQLQLMKAICPFQKYHIKQSHGKGVGDHRTISFLNSAPLHSVRWWSKHLLSEVQEQKAESYFPFILEIFFVPLLKDRCWGLLWGHLEMYEGRMGKWAVIQPAKVIWKPGSTETIETSWLAAVILFLEDWLTLQQLSVFLQEKVWGKSIVFSYWGILLSCLWSSGFWGLLPSKSLFHFSELQCGVALAGLFFREVLNPAFTRAYPNVMGLVPDQDWSFQSQQLRSYFTYFKTGLRFCFPNFLGRVPVCLQDPTIAKVMFFLKKSYESLENCLFYYQ